MKRNFQWALILLLVFSLCMVSGISWAVEFPAPGQTIEHIVPWSAGGGTDAAMRGFVRHAQKHVGTDIYTKNITGGLSAVGVLEMMRARPDGYTIATMTYDTFITVPFFEVMEGFDLNQAEVLCVVTEHPTALIVPMDSPWETLEDFVQDARERPGQIKIANAGTGGVWHLPVLDFERKADISFHHIPYAEGAGPQREALVSQEVDASSMSIVAALPAIDAGQSRVLAIMSPERDPLYPDVPTFVEFGYDVVWGSFRALGVPVATPEPVKEYLEEAFANTFNDPEFQEWADSVSLGQWWMSREDATSYIMQMQNEAFSLMDELVEEGLLELH